MSRINYLDAISKGQYHKVIHFIENGMDINAKDDNGETGILKAMKHGYKEIVKYLLQNGVNVKNDTNLIFEAAKKGYLDIVIYLLKYEQSSDIRKQALSLAQKALTQKKLSQGIQEQNLDKVYQAIKNGADVNQIDMLSWSPLMNATLKNNGKITKLLIDHQADVNYKNAHHETPLSKAVEVGDLFTVEALLNKGAQTNTKDKQKNTPLLLAVKHGDLDIIKLLIKHQAKLNIKNKEGVTPLSLAIKNNFIDIVEFLIKKGAKQKNALELAFQYKHYFLADVLLKYEYNYARRMHFLQFFDQLDTHTKLKIQIRKNDIKAVKQTLKTTTCNTLDELLFTAIKKSRYQIVNYLILSGANPNTYINNLSPLMVAVSRGDKKMVKTLIASGADVNGKGNFILGFPITIAINEGHVELTKYLVEHGADIDKPYGFKLSAREEASQCEHVEIIEYFKNLN